MSPGRELVGNEEQYENRKMKSIVVEEQEEGSESETGSVDLDRNLLFNVLERVDLVTLGRAGCVNKQWHRVAQDWRLWERLVIRIWSSNYGDDEIGGFIKKGRLRNLSCAIYRRWRESSRPKDLDFYSIDFSKKIRPWR